MTFQYFHNELLLFFGLWLLLSIDNHLSISTHFAHVAAAVDVAKHLGAAFDVDEGIALRAALMPASEDAAPHGAVALDGDADVVSDIAKFGENNIRVQHMASLVFRSSLPCSQVQVSGATGM